MTEVAIYPTNLVKCYKVTPHFSVLLQKQWWQIMIISYIHAIIITGKQCEQSISHAIIIFIMYYRWKCTKYIYRVIHESYIKLRVLLSQAQMMLSQYKIYQGNN